MVNRYKEEVLKEVDWDQILLESEALWQLGHPWRLSDVARYIGKLRIAPAILMELGLINARRFFGLE